MKNYIILGAVLFLLAFSIYITPSVEAGWIVNSTPMFVHYEKEPINFTYELEDLRGKVNNKVYFDSSEIAFHGNALNDEFRIKAIEINNQKDNAIDSGLGNERVELDWTHKGATRRCLGITINNNILQSAQDLYLYTTETDFETTELYNFELNYINTEEVTDYLNHNYCSYKEVEAGNGSIVKEVDVCSSYIEEVNREVEIKTPIALSNAYVGKKQIMQFASELDNGFYEYCFDVPLYAGYKNKGTIYAKYGNKVYVDKQHSSWWNESYDYSQQIVTDSDLKRYETFRITLDTQTLITQNKLDEACNGLHLIFNDTTEIDYIFGNYSFLDGNSDYIVEGNGCDNSNSTIYFQVQENSTNSNEYVFYYGDQLGDTRMDNVSNVFLAWEDFEDGTIDPFVTQVGASDVINGRMFLNQTTFTRVSYNVSGSLYNWDSNLRLAYQMYGNNSGFTFRGGIYNSSHKATLQDGLFDTFLNYDNDSRDSLHNKFGDITYKNTSEELNPNNYYNLSFVFKPNGDDISLVNGTALVWDNQDDLNDGRFTWWGLGFNGQDSAVDNLILWMENDNQSYILEAEATRPGLNAAPTQDAPFIETDGIGNYTIFNLTAYNQTTEDAEGDQVKTIYSFWKNGIPFSNGMWFMEDSGNDNTIITDYSGNGYNGTIYGANCSRYSGHDGFGACKFDGTNDYIGLGNNFNDIIAGVDKQFTISSWVYPNTNVTQTIFGKYSTSGNNREFLLRIRYDKSLITNINFGAEAGGDARIIQSNDLVENNEWTHIVMTYDGSIDTNDGLDRVVYYINGVASTNTMLATSGALGDIVSADAHSCIGAYCDSSGNFEAGSFNGTIDDLAIYNRTLTPTEIMLLYQNDTRRIQSERTEVGDEWIVTAYATDGKDASVGKNASIIIENQLPLVSDVNITSINTNNYTIGNISMGYTFSDGDEHTEQTRAIKWSMDGIENTTFYNVTGILGDNLTTTSTWNVSVNVYDGFNWSGWSYNATINLINSKPEVKNTTLISASDFNYSNSSITGDYDIYDETEEIEIYFISRWFTDDIENVSHVNQTIIEAVNLTKGQVWKVQFKTFNGYELSNWGENASITILNTPLIDPTIIIPSIDKKVYNYTEALTCSGSTDYDGDSINYEFYIMNLTNITLLQNTTSTTYTYTYEWLNGSYLWNCRANDGTDVSSWFENNITLHFNTTRIFNIEEYHLNTAQQGSSKRFAFNTSYNDNVISDIEATLYWNNTAYSVTETNGTNKTSWERILTIPTNVQNYVNFTWNLTLYLSNGTIETQGFQYNQSISLITLNTECSGTNETTWAVLNLTQRDEVNDTLINGDTEIAWTIWQESSGANYNFTFQTNLNDTNQTFICLDALNDTTDYYRASAHILYVANSYDYRNYFLNNHTLDNVTDDVILYLLEISQGTKTDVYVRDENTIPYVSYYIQAQRYDVGTDSYKLVEMGKTDNDGYDSMYLRQNDAWYRFLIKDTNNQVVFTSEKTKIKTNEIFFTISETGTFSDIYSNFKNIDYSITFNNNTRTFTLVYTTTDGVLTEGCLNVYSIDVQGRTEYCDSCSSSASSTIKCTIPNEAKNYYANFYVKKNPWYDVFVYELKEILENTMQQSIGKTGVFFTILFSIVIVGGGLAFGVVGAIVSFLLVFIAMAIIGILKIHFATILGLALLGGLLLAKLRD